LVKGRQDDLFTDSNGRMSQDQMIVDLTTHGHQNKDIYLITQDPERLNRGIRKLVEKMYLLKRPPQLPPFTSVYVFSRWLRDPWQATKNPDNYHDNYIFKFNKKWQEMYESASKHTSIRFHIQKKFFYAGFAVIAMLTGAYYLFMNSGAKDIVKAGLIL
jgi:zona occludens toxin